MRFPGLSPHLRLEYVERRRGRARPSDGAAAGGGSGAPASRESASTTASVAASVTSRRYKLDLVAARMAKGRQARTGPASSSSTARSTVTPHWLTRSISAQSRAEGPRSPGMPG